MKTFLHVTIPGEPHAKLRPRVTRNGTFNPSENADATKVFRWHVKAAVPMFKEIEKSVRLGVHLVFWTMNRRADGDNFLKQVLDSGNHFLWHDDSQIDEIYVRVWRGTQIAPETLLQVYEIEK